eukprot:CAMPEP_0175447986 /NCGR_PEP_ID=MMETSP0095-20121207/61093_1 /TAXON_ID=311494 /ORGANISM="Alexandrium monilatum, Strain CCMP3105" /LENGTH=66 /DNA_ID=CAMNT_0016748357 /DNA_START=62 /DNA_END=260 /DNA_ORIENTATION=-
MSKAQDSGNCSKALKAASDKAPSRYCVRMTFSAIAESCSSLVSSDNSPVFFAASTRTTFEPAVSKA